MQRMNYWGEKWDAHFDLCPCDVHFNQWVETRRLTGQTIYHLGTGTHHVVGQRQAELGNNVFAITASREEHEAYVLLAIANAALAKRYLVYFGDVYLVNARLLPDFDLATLFHLGEFLCDNTASREYGGVTDRGVLDIVTDKTRPGGHIVLYPGSNGWPVMQPLVAAWEKEKPVVRAEEFKTLLVYRKI
jgi:hypothetical protein